MVADELTDDDRVVVNDVEALLDTVEDADVDSDDVIDDDSVEDNDEEVSLSQGGGGNARFWLITLPGEETYSTNLSSCVALRFAFDTIQPF